MSTRPASLVAIFAAALAPGVVLAQPTPRAVVAKSSSPAATFCTRSTNGDPFRTLPDNADLPAGSLLVSLPGGAFESKSGAVTVKSLADYDARSPLPILETALTLGDPKDVDLDLTL